MQKHIEKNHSDLQKAAKTESNLVRMKGQTTIANAFAAKLPTSSARATAITRDIGVFIAADMRPFSVVENLGFRRLIRTLEPKYAIPSRTHFTRTVVPTLYNECKVNVVQTLKDAETIALTTDGWTSRCTQSYITITAHTINSKWEMVNFVLQTRPHYESHTGANIAEVLQAAVTDWNLRKPNHAIAIVTDNARNMDVAVREAGFEPHIKCFAHTINLATQAGLGVARVARLLGRVRRVTAFFHRSSTAAASLTSKQKLLELPQHKLIMDVTTRWNSTLDMLVRYLEQQAAIAAALTGPEVRQHARNIDTLDTCDIVNAEDLVKLLNPLKTATTVLCEEKTPTVSLIVPLKNMIEQSMAPNDSDSPTVTDVKRAILTNISGRYSGDVYNYLLESTALDPRFQTLPQLDHDQREAVFQSIKKRIEQLLQNQPTDETSAHCSTHWRDGALGAEGGAEGGPESEETEPATKKTALEDLLGDAFSKTEQSSKGIEREIELYRREPSISLSCCPLKWWRENSSKYPLLSPLVKAYFSIPATSVPSERVFSTAGDIVTAQRSQLLPENVDMLIFLKKNMSLS
ncbi:E3 SUMO-protein ligase ZBED1-like [Paramisgurnus dabryanus]|uniref:E3 SUMO-protein ligase ZBED1-like n=2 Tax=Paramisgurnus dabryanus TaxID=90735 RepID=UPI003CCFDF3F